MNFFSRKKQEPMNSEDYEKLSKKITDLATLVEELKVKFRVLETNYDNLRGNFNRKLAGLKKEEVDPDPDPMDQKTDSKSINTSVILPYG